MEGYISVTEYANRYGKDPGNVRRLLALGKLPGSKVGNQWILPENAPYPEDGRKKAKQTEVSGDGIIDALIQSIAEPLISRIEECYGDNARQLILYGSYARGSQTEFSDVDIAVMLEKKAEPMITDKMIDYVAKLELEHDKVISLIEIERPNYERWKTVLPFYINIAKEGRTLWRK